MTTDQSANLTLTDYGEMRAGGHWADLPDDGYLYDNLVEMLLDADNLGEVRQLFADDRWFHARVAQGGYAGYLRDLAAVQLVTGLETIEQIEQDEHPSGLVDLFRYALMASTLQAIAVSYPPQLIQRAVALGIWSFAKAKWYIDRIGEATARATYLFSLLDYPTLAQHERTAVKAEVGKAIDQIADDDLAIVGLLAGMASYCDGEEQRELLLRAFHVVLHGGRSSYAPPVHVNRLDDTSRFFRKQKLLRLLPAIPDALLPEFYELIAAIDDPDTRVWLLAAVKERGQFAEEEAKGDSDTIFTEQLLQDALRIRQEVGRANALCRVADHTQGLTIDRILDAVDQLQTVWQPRVLIRCMPQATAPQHERILQRALDIAAAGEGASTLAELVKFIAEPQRPRVLAAIFALADPDEIALTYKVISDYLPDRRLAEALALARAVETPAYRAEALASLAHRFTDAEGYALLAEARAAVASEASAQARAILLQLIATAYADQPSEQAAILQDALAAIDAIASDEERANVLVQSLPGLPDALLSQAMDCALRIDHYRVGIMNALAPRLDVALVQRAIRALATAPDQREQIQFLEQLLPQLTPPLHQEALSFMVRAALAMLPVAERTTMLLKLLPQLNHAEQQQAIATLRTAAHSVLFPEELVKPLVAAAHQLTDPLRSELLGEAKALFAAVMAEVDRTVAEATQIPVGFDVLADTKQIATIRKVTALTAFAGALPEAARRPYLQQALALAADLKDEFDWAKAMIELAEATSLAFAPTVFQVIVRHPRAYARARPLRALAAKLDAPFIERAMTTMTVDWYDPYAIFALIDLIATLDPERRLTLATLALARISELLPTGEQLELLTLTPLVEYLDPAQRQALVALAVAIIQRADEPLFAVARLGPLARRLHGQERTELILTTVALSQPLAHPLTDLCQFLQPTTLEELPPSLHKTLLLEAVDRLTPPTPQARSELLTQWGVIAPLLPPSLADHFCQTLLAICGEWRWA